MKVLVLGYGSAGRRHVAHLLALGQTVGVYDPKQAPLSTGQVRCFATESLAWEWEPEAVVIATPAALHAPYLEAAARRELPTFIEKPLGLSRLDIAAALGVLADSGYRAKPVQVGYQLRLHPDVAAVKAVLDPSRVLLATFWVSSNHQRWPGGSYGDALLEYSHEIDLALYMLGPATVAAALSWHHERRWAINLLHVSGAASQIVIDDAADHDARGARLHVPGPTLGWNWHGGTPNAEAVYREQVQRFISAAEGLSQPPCSLADGLAVLDACDTARAFSAGKRPESQTASP